VLGGGTTFGASAVELAIRETGLQGRVRRLAYVPDEDLPALYSGAGCVAIVSLYEGFGMPALEALACGAPVVAGNYGSLPEIVGPAGLSVNPLDVDSIAAGLTNAVSWPMIRERLRAAGPVRAAQFDWAAAARVTRRALERAHEQDAGKSARSTARSVAS
jgi:glycosyltransferase involved in cell wall biosynthesis